MKLRVPVSPCTSCPYRRDTPPGVWDRAEYEKLRGYDDRENAATGVFLCHHGKRDAVCRGWLSVHADSLAVRLAVIFGSIPAAALSAVVKAPLYASGAEAADAGVRGLKRPGRKARAVIARLLRARANAPSQPRERA